MTTDERVKLLNEVGQEIVTQEELVDFLSKNASFTCYDGFEPSGQMHIAAGILRVINVNKAIATGAHFKMLVADWHAYLNNKMDGDLEKIQTVGKYFIEVWKAAGMDMNHVKFLWASEAVKDPKYWELVMKIAKTNSIKRFAHSAEIIGRAESDSLTLAQLMYVAMQAADVFYLDAKVTQLGMDQRKVNMLAREIANQLGFQKPIVVSHHMLLGLIAKPTSVTISTNTSNEPQTHELASGDITVPPGVTGTFSESVVDRTIRMKMSKSNPDSAIFMTDSTEEISRKIAKAYCPEGIVEENPILEYCKYIIFESLERLGLSEITIERPEKFGGNISFTSYEALESAFVSKDIHPMDLKNTVAALLDQLLQPVRKHFEENEEAKKLLEQVKSFNVTR